MMRTMMMTSKMQELARITAKKGNRVVLPLVEQYLLSQWDTAQDRKTDVLHVSEMSKKDWCERASYWRIKGRTRPNTKFSFTMANIYDEGNSIHTKWQTWLKETGKLWGDWKCLSCAETAFGYRAEQLNHGWYDAHASHDHVWEYKEVALYSGIIYGHEDGAVDDRLIEFKSVGVGTLRHEMPDLLARFYVRTTTGEKLYDLDSIWKALKHPFASHIRQANLYLYLAQSMGLSFTRASLVYEYKPNQQTKEFVISMSQDVLDPLLDRATTVKYALDSNRPPPCPYGGCKQCQAYENSEDKPASEVSPQRRIVTRKGSHRSRGASS
jgi:hypothetical protein